MPLFLHVFYSKISLLCLSYLFLKLLKFPKLRIYTKHFDRSYRITTLDWTSSILDQEYHIFGNARAFMHCTMQAMTRAKTVNLDINQLNVSVCCVYSRISRQEILPSSIILIYFHAMIFPREIMKR